MDRIPEDALFASDFMLAEIRTLRAVQPVAQRARLKGRFAIPTLDEMATFAHALRLVQLIDANESVPRARRRLELGAETLI